MPANDAPAESSRGRGRTQGQRPIQPAARGQFVAQGLGGGGRQWLARLAVQAESGGQHEAVGHRHAQLRQAAQLPAFAARRPGPRLGGGRPIQHGGSHAAAPGATPCTKRLTAASNSVLRLERGRPSQRSIAPRYRNCNWQAS